MIVISYIWKVSYIFVNNLMIYLWSMKDFTYVNKFLLLWTGSLPKGKETVLMMWPYLSELMTY